MKKTTMTIIAALVSTVMTAPIAQAQTTSRNCAPREVVVQRLADKYGESRKSIGIGQQGTVMETFASEDTGTWTITVTMPTGVTCLVASGQSFETLAEIVPDPEHDA